ncbi:MAG: hypothetical protein AAF950_07065 [Pseudomonadota bacterium]
MAVWQFTFHYVERLAVEKLDGPDAIVLSAFRPVDLEPFDIDAETTSYWKDRSPYSYAKVMKSMLPPRTSWSDDALMFGEENGDSVELWDDDVRIRLDIRSYNEPLVRQLVELAAADDLKLAMSETGRVIAPTYEKLIREIKNSRAMKFILDPKGLFDMIAKESD